MTGFTAKFIRWLTFLATVLLCTAIPALAQKFPYSDPNLIEKLFKNDFQNIGNDNLSRQDLIGLMAAFGLPDDPQKKCNVVGDESIQGGLRFVKYMQFLQSDFRTGEYPSKEARELAFISALFPDPPYVYILDPNLRRMAEEIERNGCNSTRIQTIRKNFVQLLDDRIAGRNIPGSSAVSGLPNLTAEEIAERRRLVQAQIAAAEQRTAGAPVVSSRGGPSSQPAQPAQPATAPTPQPVRPAPAAPATPPASPPPARQATPAPTPAAASPSVIPAQTALLVKTVDVIDLVKLDETRTYKATTIFQTMSGTRVVLAQGTEVLLKLSRPQPPLRANVYLVEIRAVSTTVDGKPVTLTATPFMTAVPGAETPFPVPKELPVGTTMSFIIQRAQ